MSTYEIVHSSVDDWSAAYTGPKFHAVLCDPPYLMDFMAHRLDWDKSNQNNPQGWGNAILPHLLPGAVVLMFGGTRTFHRLAVGMEAAGFEMFDTLVWLRGTGWPKSQDISKLIDKRDGNKRTEVIGRYKPPDMKSDWNLQNAVDQRSVEMFSSSRNNLEVMAPASPESAIWSGWGTALKPAWEPILAFRVPSKQGYADLATQFGTGALNIDGCRIDPGTAVSGGGNNFNAWREGEGRDDRPALHQQASGGHTLGRYPSNVILDEESAVQLDAQTGVLKSGKAAKGGHKRNPHDHWNCYNPFNVVSTGTLYGDAGGASRFFYCARASTAERNAGLQARENDHPTIKPISLTVWLATLCLPSSAVTSRRLLVPFAGVGSEIAGAVLAGWETIVGIEQDARYCEMAQRRIPTLVSPSNTTA